MLTGLGAEVVVKRNDEINLKEVEKFDKIVLSPGPGLPNESEGMMQVISEFYDKKPILGVCLGMQALAIHFGDSLYNQEKVQHGIQVISHQISESKLLKSIDENFNVGLYHSWAIECKENSPFKITSKSENDVIMSFEHKEFPLFGVQFHPESILTPEGKDILNNFLQL